MTLSERKCLLLTSLYFLLNLAVLFIIPREYETVEAILRFLSTIPLLFIVLEFNDITDIKVKLVIGIFLIISIGQSLVAFNRVDTNLLLSGFLFIAIKFVVFEILRASGGILIINFKKLWAIFLVPLLLVFYYGHFVIGPLFSNDLYLVSMAYSFIDAMLLSMTVYYTFIKKSITYNGFIGISLLVISDILTGFRYSSISHTNSALIVFVLNCFTRFFFLKFLLIDFLKSETGCFKQA